jgi:hypothetical protein
MKFLTRLFGGKGGDDGNDPPSMPWDRRPSILEFISSHVPTDGPGLAEGGYTLPDDEQVGRGSKLRWTAGAMDGVAIHHMGLGKSEETVHRTVDRVLAYCRQPSATNKAAIYEHVIGGREAVCLTDQIRGQFAPVIPAQTETIKVRLLRLSGRHQPYVVATARLKTVRPCDDKLEIFQTARRFPPLNLY